MSDPVSPALNPAQDGCNVPAAAIDPPSKPSKPTKTKKVDPPAMGPQNPTSLGYAGKDCTIVLCLPKEDPKVRLMKNLIFAPTHRSYRAMPATRGHAPDSSEVDGWDWVVLPFVMRDNTRFARPVVPLLKLGATSFSLVFVVYGNDDNVKTHEAILYNLDKEHGCALAANVLRVDGGWVKDWCRPERIDTQARYILSWLATAPFSRKAFAGTTSGLLHTPEAAEALKNRLSAEQLKMNGICLMVVDGLSREAKNACSEGVHTNTALINYATSCNEHAFPLFTTPSFTDLLGRMASHKWADTPVGSAAVENPVEKPAYSLFKLYSKLAAEKSAVEKLAVEKPAVEKPAAEKPAAEKPAAEKPAAEKPAAKKQAKKRPLSDDEQELSDSGSDNGSESDDESESESEEQSDEEEEEEESSDDSDDDAKPDSTPALSKAAPATKRVTQASVPGIAHLVSSIDGRLKPSIRQNTDVRGPRNERGRRRPAKQRRQKLTSNGSDALKFLAQLRSVVPVAHLKDLDAKVKVVSEKIGEYEEIGKVDQQGAVIRASFELVHVLTRIIGTLGKSDAPDVNSAATRALASHMARIYLSDDEKLSKLEESLQHWSTTLQELRTFRTSAVNEADQSVARLVGFTQ